MYSAFVVIITVVMILIPVWILLLIFKRSDKPSKWKYPPSKRVTQFVFSLGNLIFVSLLILPYSMFIFLSITSVLGMVYGLLILFLGFVSLLSLFRPVFTFGIFLTYVVIGVTSYYASPARELPSAYVDICNQLRNDPHCVESDKNFSCTPPSKHSGKLIDKVICENTTNGNSDYEFEDILSPFEGETHVTKIPLLYVKNLPRNNCKNRSCGYKVDTELVDFRNPCSNCLDSRRLDTRLRIELVPVGTKLRVVDAFQLRRKGFMSSGPVHKVLLLEDEIGTRSEISQLGFELDVIGGNRNWDISLENMVLGDLEKIEKETMVTRNFCFMSKKGEKALIEYRLKRFMKDFHIEEEILFSSFLEKEQTKWKGIDHCTDITFRTKNAYLLGHYFFKEWDLW